MEFPHKIVELTPTTSGGGGGDTGASIEQTDDNSDPEPDNNIRTQIMNECIPEILNIFDLHAEFNESMLKEIFKGFIYNAEKNSIYLFFDMSGHNIPSSGSTTTTTATTTPPPLQYWGILDEIINTKHICGTDIQPEIVELFTSNPDLKEIRKHANGGTVVNIPYPLSLYMCQTGDTGATNSSELENVLVVSSGTTILEKTVPHPFLGDFYYFSSSVLPSMKKTDIGWSDIQRYVVFLEGDNDEQESYIVKDLNEITDEQRQAYLKKNEDMDIMTVWFKENDIQLWCIRSPLRFVRL
jgi:hypothetical protein